MTELTLISFKNESSNSDLNVVQRLEEALLEAKKGNISNCIVVMAFKDNSVMDCWANGNKPFVMVGALESIKREFMDSIIEKR